MMLKVDLILSFLFLLGMIVYKFFLEKIYKKREKTIIDVKHNKILICFYVLMVVVFVVSLFMNVMLDGNNVDKTGEYLFHALSVAILVCPLSLQGMNLIYFKKASKLMFTRTVVTNQISKSLLERYNRARLNIIIIGNKKAKGVFFPSFEENEEKKYKNKLNENIFIKTDNIKFIKKIVDEETTVFEFEDLDRLYDAIMADRGKYDNYTKMIKYLLITYGSLLISYFFLNLMGFPWKYNLLLAVLLKFGTVLVSRFLYNEMEFDTDLETRQSQIYGTLFDKQEVMFIFIQMFINTMLFCLPYMYVLAVGGTQEFGNTLFYIIFVYINLFMTFSYSSESNIIKNVWKSLRNKGMVIYFVSCIIFTIFLNFSDYFETRNIELHNNVACILWGFVAVLFCEFIKLIRYMTKRGKMKNEVKNNE